MGQRVENLVGHRRRQIKRLVRGPFEHVDQHVSRQFVRLVAGRNAHHRKVLLHTEVRRLAIRLSAHSLRVVGHLRYQLTNSKKEEVETRLVQNPLVAILFHLRQRGYEDGS